MDWGIPTSFSPPQISQLSSTTAIGYGGSVDWARTAAFRTSAGGSAFDGSRELGTAMMHKIKRTVRELWVPLCFVGARPTLELQRVRNFERIHQ